MAKFTRSLKNKLNLLLKELGENTTFTVADAVGVLRTKETTVRWVLWNLCDKGKIMRIGKGLYTFRSEGYQKSLPHLSTMAKVLASSFLIRGSIVVWKIRYFFLYQNSALLSRVSKVIACGKALRDLKMLETK